MFLFSLSTPESPPEQNDGRQFFKMEQLTSHTRAGRHECQLYFTYALNFFCNQSNCFADVAVAVLGCFIFLNGKIDSV